MTDGISLVELPDFTVWCIEDGTHVFDAGDFPGLAYEEQQTRLDAAGETEIRTAFNAFLVRDSAGVYTLVDAGCGTAFGEKAGFLCDRLAALGVQPDSISRLIFTHLHTDHCGGALQDGAAVFPHAQVFVHASELAHWTNTPHLAAEVLTVYRDRIVHVSDGHEIAAGLTVWDLPGHTPGHFGLRVGSTLVLMGDILHSEALQLGDPRLSSENDVDAWQAAETRLAGLREVAEYGLIYSGGHILGPQKFARLVEVGDGFIAVSL